MQDDFLDEEEMKQLLQQERTCGNLRKVWLHQILFIPYHLV